MKKLVIDRARWSRGRTEMRTLLFNDESDLMCCLGFDMINEGYTQDVITNKAAPSSCTYTTGDFRNSHWSKEINLELASELLGDYILPSGLFEDVAINVNDSINMNDEVREKLLQELFLLVDIDLTFI